jgi:hypothetical protein
LTTMVRFAVGHASAARAGAISHPNSYVSLKRYCLVPARWTPDDLARHSCADRSHVHLSRSQVWDLEREGLLEWVRRPISRAEKGIVKIRRIVAARGLSCRIGEALAEGLRLRLPWARAMLADIRLTPARLIR